MANIRTFHLPHYPDYPIYVALFKNVTNAEFLRGQLLAANQEFDYAFLDAAMVSRWIDYFLITAATPVYQRFYFTLPDGLPYIVVHGSKAFF
jgi:hypothetical protein